MGGENMFHCSGLGPQSSHSLGPAQLPHPTASVKVRLGRALHTTPTAPSQLPPPGKGGDATSSQLRREEEKTPPHVNPSWQVAAALTPVCFPQDEQAGEAPDWGRETLAVSNQCTELDGAHLWLWGEGKSQVTEVLGCGTRPPLPAGCSALPCSEECCSGHWASTGQEKTPAPSSSQFKPI